VTLYVGCDVVGLYFEVGDVFVFGDALVVGYGLWIEELVLKYFVIDFGIWVCGLWIIYLGMYYFDLVFCLFDDCCVLVCLVVLEDEFVAALLDLVSELLVLIEEEVLMMFCVNLIVFGWFVLMLVCFDWVCA